MQSTNVRQQSDARFRRREHRRSQERFCQQITRFAIRDFGKNQNFSSRLTCEARPSCKKPLRINGCDEHSQATSVAYFESRVSASQVSAFWTPTVQIYSLIKSRMQRCVAFLGF